MGDIAMAAKPVAKAVIGALIVVLGLVCVLNLSSEEQIRVEDKVVAQAGGDQDDLTPAEKNLIAAASSHKITPAQAKKVEKVHVNVKKSKEPEMDASMEAEYNKWVQHSIKHDAKKEIKKEKRADKKADAKT